MPILSRCALMIMSLVVGCRESNLAPEQVVSQNEWPFQNNGHCGKQEAIIFQCEIKKEMISVCGLKNRNGRFVRFSIDNDKLPWKLSEKDMRNKQHFSWHSNGFSGGGSMEIGMVDMDRELIAYSRTVRTNFDGNGNDAEAEAGVIGRLGNQEAFRWKCDNPSEAMRYKANPADYMPTNSGSLE